MDRHHLSTEKIIMTTMMMMVRMNTRDPFSPSTRGRGRCTVGPPTWVVNKWKEQQEAYREQQRAEREFYDRKRKAEEEARNARLRVGFENFANKSRKVREMERRWFPEGLPKPSSRY